MESLKFGGIIDRHYLKFLLKVVIHILISFVLTIILNKKKITGCKFESHPGEVYLIQYYVIKFVSDLRQVSGFLQFPPPINLIATI
jgi:hypothetical protein